MRLARILDKNNQVVYAAEQKDGRLLKIEGDIVEAGKPRYRRGR